MKREIKFRVWDGEKIVSLSRAFTNDLVTIQHNDDDSDWANDLDGTYSFVELMQYTGLKDKNGVEIYEGDVIAYYHANQECHREEVSWRAVGFNFLFCTSVYEVIGNIYENPELLEGKE